MLLVSIHYAWCMSCHGSRGLGLLLLLLLVLLLLHQRLLFHMPPGHNLSIVLLLSLVFLELFSAELHGLQFLLLPSCLLITLKSFLPFMLLVPQLDVFQGFEAAEARFK